MFGAHASERSPVGDEDRLRLGVALRWFVAYLSVGFSLLYFQRHFGPSLWYPPIALGLALFLLRGKKYWPVILIADAIVSWFQFQSGPWVTLLVAANTTAETLVAQHLLMRFGFDRRLRRVRDLLLLVVYGALFPTLVGTASCATLLSGLGEFATGEALSTWLNWWIGDCIGLVVFCPVILVMWPAQARRRWSLKFKPIALERALVASAAVVLPIVTFSADAPLAKTVPGLYQFLLLLPVLWAALRLGTRTSFTVIALINTFAALSAAHAGFTVASVAHGVGPSVLELQLLIMTLSMAGGLVSLSVASERKARLRSELALESLEQRNQLLHHKMQELEQAESALAAERERLTVTLQSIGDGVLGADKNGNVTLVNACAETMTGWSAHAALGQPLLEVLDLLDEQTGISRRSHRSAADLFERRAAAQDRRAPRHHGR